MAPYLFMPYFLSKWLHSLFLPKGTVSGFVGGTPLPMLDNRILRNYVAVLLSFRVLSTLKNAVYLKYVGYELKQAQN